MAGSKKSALVEASPTLFRRRWSARGLDEAISSIEPEALCTEYVALRDAAPRRALTGKRYFVDHTGMVPRARKSNRLEEHCAIALVNLGRRWPRPGGGWFRLLDYQVPLKALRTDARIGKIDLLGVTDGGRLIIVELKVEGRSGGRSDAPPAALMEGLRYAAMVEADLEAIALEAEHRFGDRIARTPPIVQLLAPQAWWHAWLDLPTAGDWGLAFFRLVEGIEARTGVTVECLAHEDSEVTYGSDGWAPRLDRVPALCPVRLGDKLGDKLGIGEALPAPSADRKGAAVYRDTIHRTLWSWADEQHGNELDGGRRTGRPPVLRSDAAEKNVLVPPDGRHVAEVRAVIAKKQRHRHFASLRSSQALAQSVFGAIAVFDRLDLLEGITSDCGRPAFFADRRGWTLDFEHEVDTLGEPRPTSIDVLLSGPDYRVAIECKFTEVDFGTCSRPRLKPGDATYVEQRCDGNYRTQAGRSDRCALTAIGVRYWNHLPQLFAWPADRDHEPCPFGSVYQLARNALAAVVPQIGDLDATRGHALVIYDERNPAFQAGGTADRQWEMVMAACLVPGLLRRLSWQQLLAFVDAVPDLEWLVDGLRDKYGIVAIRQKQRRLSRN